MLHWRVFHHDGDAGFLSHMTTVLSETLKKRVSNDIDLLAFWQLNAFCMVAVIDELFSYTTPAGIQNTQISYVTRAMDHKMILGLETPI